MTITIALLMGVGIGFLLGTAFTFWNIKRGDISHRKIDVVEPIDESELGTGGNL